MRTKLPTPPREAIIYEDAKLYVCLASFPVAVGHVVIVWKAEVSDLHLLNRKDYEYLMDKMDEVRTAMLKALKVKKVYLVYMDEANQVHWHLVPRHNEMGYDVLTHKAGKLTDFSLAKKIREKMDRLK